MKKIEIEAYKLLKKIRAEKPLIHHLTNWVTIYDCANIVKTLGASPVMAHAREEAADMSGIASAVVLNIGTLTVDFIEAMKVSARTANKKGIPVILDACGAGATRLRDEKCFELMQQAKIDIIKGNSSEIARLCGETARTKGVDAATAGKDMPGLAKRLSRKYNCTVVITGKEDIVSDGSRTYFIRNGHPFMEKVVGTGCMAASVIGTFAAVCPDLAYAAVSGLACFEIASECAAKTAKGPASFKEKVFDCLFNLDEKKIDRMQKVFA